MSDVAGYGLSPDGSVQPGADPSVARILSLMAARGPGGVPAPQPSSGAWYDWILPYLHSIGIGQASPQQMQQGPVPSIAHGAPVQPLSLQTQGSAPPASMPPPLGGSMGEGYASAADPTASPYGPEVGRPPDRPYLTADDLGLSAGAATPTAASSPGAGPAVLPPDPGGASVPGNAAVAPTDDTGRALSADDGGGGDTQMQALLGRVQQGLLNYKNDPWMAVARAGFASAASRNPTLFGALGEGALTGLESYQQGQQTQLGHQAQAADLALRAKEVEEQEKFREAEIQRYDAMIPGYQAKTALTNAQTNLADARTKWFDARSAGPMGLQQGWKQSALTQLQGQTDPTTGKPYTTADAIRIVEGRGDQRNTIADMQIKQRMAADSSFVPSAQDWQDAYGVADAALAKVNGGGGAPPAAAGGLPQGMTPQQAYAGAAAAIQAGAPADQVKARLQQWGLDPSQVQ